MIAKPGEVCLVNTIPPCNFCDEPGPYDFKTVFGSWANGCQDHYEQHQASPGLGVGKAQLWITHEEAA